MKESFVFLADGFEEIEALTAVDVMRRAGMSVKTVSITSSLQVTGAHGVTVTADVLFDNTLFTHCSWVVLPGGMPGATNLHDFQPLLGLLRSQLESPHGRIAAICAAPAVVLGNEGLLEGHHATCYPGFENMLKGAEYVDAPVVTDDKFVLGNGPASALLWALAIVAKEYDEEKSLSVANGMLLYPASDNKIDYLFG
ncbi:MAG: DJ-1/PfpI family protein [Candidatus Amulumruptor caecigallinarius]|nr:DJ-1/PfpI family protein [Candidatus Amulumruptor caecigallinarius]